ncbi:site-specific integrase [Pseudomonas mosselii]|uniref:site-specific integrase n=1 Tax=Pseudomonas mosselii TaxID=78327 RepID=UPI001BD5E891|nr:site-specific integrase [Pseudomonas mosselii]MBS9759777.1 site-specific integrase [Pseudomonas mosselii]
MTPQELLQEYLVDHDLRQASAKIYGAAMKSLEKHFGKTVDVETIDRRDILAWRNRVIEGGLSKRSWNTYSNHLRTMWGYGIEYGILTDTGANPFKKTTVIAPKRPSKIIAGEAIHQARRWLKSLADQEASTGERARITPAWFWLATFEMFYYTGIRLNALLCIRLQDVDWDRQLILVRGETEKTHREFRVPIMDGLAPHIRRLMDEAGRAGFAAEEQLFNVNRFSRHYKRREMNSDQVEAMYKKLIDRLGVRMTPHRFRHTLATDLMKQPERNIHLTKNLLNHSNIATTMSYIEADYDHMRDVLHERSLQQGALHLVRRVDESAAPGSRTGQTQARIESGRRRSVEQSHHGGGGPEPGHQYSLQQICSSSQLPLPPEELFSPTLLFSLMATGMSAKPFMRSTATEAGCAYSARASP